MTEGKYIEKKLTDLTPTKFSCNFGLSCPAVLKTDNNSYLIIGKIVDHSDPAVAGRIGKDETVVEISEEILKAAIALQICDN